MLVNTLRPKQNGRHFADDIFRCIFLNENVCISIKISLKFVPKGSINNIPALVQIMAWRRPGDKPLSEAMMVNLPTRICVSLPQWVKSAHDMSFDGPTRANVRTTTWGWQRHEISLYISGPLCCVTSDCPAVVRRFRRKGDQWCEDWMCSSLGIDRTEHICVWLMNSDSI